MNVIILFGLKIDHDFFPSASSICIKVCPESIKTFLSKPKRMLKMPKLKQKIHTAIPSNSTFLQNTTHHK